MGLARERERRQKRHRISRICRWRRKALLPTYVAPWILTFNYPMAAAGDNHFICIQFIP